MAWLIHSQKGSQWDEKNRKYLKRTGTPGHMEDTGKYYYPDSYKGGRHLPKGEKADKSKKEEEHAHEYGDDMQDWEKKVHDHLAGIIQKNPDMFKNSESVINGIMDDKNLDAVKNTLKAFGVNSDKLSDGEVKQLRQKIADFYKNNDKVVDEARSGKKVKSTKSDKKKSEDTDKKDKKTKSSSKTQTSKKTPEVPTTDVSDQTKQASGGGVAKKNTSTKPAVAKQTYEGGTSSKKKKKSNIL